MKLLEFKEEKDFRGNVIYSVIDTEEGEEIGHIYWSERNKQFAFHLVADEIFTSDFKEILTEMERLTAERNKSPFCTFDE